MERLLSNQMRSAARESKQGLLYSMPTCSADRKEREESNQKASNKQREKEIGHELLYAALQDRAYRARPTRGAPRQADPHRRSPVSKQERTN
jgi:hypothetical protein